MSTHDINYLKAILRATFIRRIFFDKLADGSISLDTNWNRTCKQYKTWPKIDFTYYTRNKSCLLFIFIVLFVIGITKAENNCQEKRELLTKDQQCEMSNMDQDRIQCREKLSGRKQVSTPLNNLLLSTALLILNCIQL